jgi:hypothetical protein
VLKKCKNLISSSLLVKFVSISAFYTGSWYATLVITSLTKRVEKKRRFVFFVFRMFQYFWLIAAQSIGVWFPTQNARLISKIIVNLFCCFNFHVFFHSVSVSFLNTILDDNKLNTLNRIYNGGVTEKPSHVSENGPEKRSKYQGMGGGNLSGYTGLLNVRFLREW